MNKPNDYISTAEAARRGGVCTQRILALLAQHRIPGARKLSGVWMIPGDFKVQPAPKRDRSMTKIGPSRNGQA